MSRYDENEMLNLIKKINEILYADKTHTEYARQVLLNMFMMNLIITHKNIKDCRLTLKEYFNESEKALVQQWNFKDKMIEMFKLDQIQ